MNQNISNINIISSTDARNNWSQVIDDVVHDKPKIIRRTRDNILMTNFSILNDILQEYKFTCTRFIEEDGSVTLSLNEIDLVSNGATYEEAIQELASDILEYSKDYYNEYSFWSNASNRKKHVPYVFKALILNNIAMIGDNIRCLDGKS